MHWIHNLACTILISITAYVKLMLKPHLNCADTSSSLATASKESSTHWLLDTVIPCERQHNNPPQIHRNIQRLAESDTDSSLTIPNSSTHTHTHLHTNTPSPHHTTSLSGCQGVPANTLRLRQQTPFCPGSTFQDFTISLSSNWLKTEQVVILFRGMLWKSKNNFPFR